jgi:hypothetical protein
VERLSERDPEPERDQDRERQEGPVPRRTLPGAAPVAELRGPRVFFRPHGS